MQHQGLAQFAVHVPTTHDTANRARADMVQRTGGVRGLAAFEDAHDHAADALFLRVAALDKVFHVSSFLLGIKLTRTDGNALHGSGPLMCQAEPPGIGLASIR